MQAIALAANGVSDLVKQPWLLRRRNLMGVPALAFGASSLRVLRFAEKVAGIIDIDARIVVVFWDTFGV
jgi:hypothetical protein